MDQVLLYVSEKSYGTRESERHVLELPKDLVPVFDADLPLVKWGVAANISLR